MPALTVLTCLRRPKMLCVRDRGATRGVLRRRQASPSEGRAQLAMIAATALANDLPVYTCNPADFEGIDVVAVAVPDAPG